VLRGIGGRPVGATAGLISGVSAYALGHPRALWGILEGVFWGAGVDFWHIGADFAILGAILQKW